HRAGFRTGDGRDQRRRRFLWRIAGADGRFAHACRRRRGEARREKIRREKPDRHVDLADAAGPHTGAQGRGFCRSRRVSGNTEGKITLAPSPLIGRNQTRRSLMATPNGIKMKTLTVRLPESLFLEIEKEARELQMSKSELVRQILEQAREPVSEQKQLPLIDE